jgi:hypothetical protein
MIGVCRDFSRASRKANLALFQHDAAVTARRITFRRPA